MDEINNLLDVFPPGEARETCETCLKELKASKGLDEYHCKQLIRLLTQYPYPTLQILQILSSSKNTIKRALYPLLLELLLNTNQLTSEFISFISNLDFELWKEFTSEHSFISKLSGFLNDNQLWIALLCNPKENIIKELLSKCDEIRFRNCTKWPTKEFVAYYAIKERHHFIPLAYTLENIKLEDKVTKNNLLLLKIIDELTQNKLYPISQIPNIGRWLKDFDVSALPDGGQEIQKIFYAGLKRILVIIEFVKNFPDKFRNITVETVLQTSSVLRFLINNDIHPGFDEGRNILTNVHKCELEMSLKSMCDNELVTFIYYSILSTVLEVILTDSTTANLKYILQKMDQLKLMFRHIRNIKQLCSLLEDIFQLVFVRYEDLRSSFSVVDATSLQQHKRNKSSKSSNPNSSEDNGGFAGKISRDFAIPVGGGGSGAATSIRQGFICRGHALKTVFSFLKTFVTKKLHCDEYKNASKDIQQRFQYIVEVIAETLWKYSVIERIDDSAISYSGNKSGRCNLKLDAEELLELVRIHADQFLEKSSSDDESRDRSNYASLIRRKAAKKRRRATIGGTVVSQSIVGAREKSEIKEKALRPNDAISETIKRVPSQQMRVKDHSIVPRMLCSPEDLAKSALAINNFSDAKHIIETFNLHNTDLDRELTFMEHQQQVKHKLANIYSSYESEEMKSSRHNDEPKATIEQIKDVAAKGFEASKIINVIDNFAQAQKIQQSDNIKALLAKHSVNIKYAHFLWQFDERNLNAITITDLILNMPFNHEITTNIFMAIKRQQQGHFGVRSTLRNYPSTITASNLTSTSGHLETSSETNPNLMLQLPKDIGCIPLLDNLCQCLRLLDNACLRNLLCDNYYSLKPRILAYELEREQAFTAVFQCTSEEIGSVKGLRCHMQLFQNLKLKCNYFARFGAYVSQLSKLLKMLDNNLELHTNEMLKYNPCDVIGELLFEHNMTPLEIESSVVSLNLNLLHIIALNICPEITGRKCKTSAVKSSASKMKQQTIYNYIWNHNRLLAFILQSIDKPSELDRSPVGLVDIQPLFFQRLLRIPGLDIFAQLYNGKKFVAALHAERLDIKLIESQLDSKMSMLELLLLKFGSHETKREQQALIDKLIMELILEDSRNIHLTFHIHDITLKAKLLHENFTKITTISLAKDLIEGTLQHKDVCAQVPIHLRLKLEEILGDITVYAHVSEQLQFESWPQAYEFGLNSPYIIFKKLIEMQHYKLCYEWCKVMKLAETTTFQQEKKLYFSTLLEALLSNKTEENFDSDTNQYLLKIMSAFPVQDCYNFLQKNKFSFRSIDLLNYTLEFLSSNRQKNLQTVDNLMNFRIAVTIFKLLTAGEREQLWPLIKHPLLIIEQFLMNAKFEILGRVLKAVRDELRKAFEGDDDAATSQTVCEYCFDKHGHVYDIHTRPDLRRNDKSLPTFYLSSGKTDITKPSAVTNSHTFILLNFNLYQTDHNITNECIDLLLRIYATKALDYQMSDVENGLEHRSQSTTDTQQSLDSLCGAFQMPKEAPTREEWMADDETIHCMCCRRAVFTMLMRRHHCRRCGRVVCFACSTHRILIPALYADVEVRVCNDCYHFTNLMQNEQTESTASGSEEPKATFNPRVHSQELKIFKWHISGNITHDKLLREEFCYEHAPSVALCLSILDYHYNQKKCVDLLIYHCRKLEKLIEPNPEVDYELISKMINCLSLAAKVRGGRDEVEIICDHSEIIMSLVQNGCENLIPPGPLRNHSIRKLADSLVQAEKWDLALEVHLKYGLPTAGVMAAHGLSCLRAGCFDTAREKLSYCMPKLSDECANVKICNFILSKTTNLSEKRNEQQPDILYIKRPQRGPALLLEILKIIECFASREPQPETLRRASIIRNSNTSLSSLLSRRKDMHYQAIPMHEPALNILSTLTNLKLISRGCYSETGKEGATNSKMDNKKQMFRQTHAFGEAMHYALTYGSHADIIQFLMRNEELSSALKYFAIQNLESDYFIQSIFLFSLQCGEVPLLMEEMRIVDPQMIAWRDVLIQTCRYLETKNLLNSLYQLQILLNDPIRASMTCVKFYSMGCENFQQLHNNAQHLQDAHKLLLAELELTQWENMNVGKIHKRRNSLLVRRLSNASVSSSVSPVTSAFPMQMDAHSLNAHINTILKQLDVAKFLANCERERIVRMENEKDVPVLITEKILKQIRAESGKTALPTLFDSMTERIQICILILLSGKNIEEGFGLAYRIMQDNRIPTVKVFGATAKYLARNQRISEVEKLLNCIISNNGTNNRELDEIIYIAINSAGGSHESEVKTALDNLAKRIHNVELRISCYIFMGQLKSAYLLANKHERLGDIKRILRQAEITNQIHMKKLCEKKLNLQQTTTTTQTIAKI